MNFEKFCPKCKTEIKTKFSYYVSCEGKVVRDHPPLTEQKKLSKWASCRKCAKRELMKYKLMGEEFEK